MSRPPLDSTSLSLPKSKSSDKPSTAAGVPSLCAHISYRCSHLVRCSGVLLSLWREHVGVCYYLERENGNEPPWLEMAVESWPSSRDPDVYPGCLLSYLIAELAQWFSGTFPLGSESPVLADNVFSFVYCTPFTRSLAHFNLSGLYPCKHTYLL